MRIIDGFDELQSLVGEDLGIGAWVAITQERIDTFAAATDDFQWVHTDPVKARTGQYGTTIAHGYLTLSLLPALAAGAYQVVGVAARINVGLDRVRFPAPVRVGSRIRNRASLRSIETGEIGLRASIRNEVQIEGSDKPACIADTVTLFILEK